MNLEDFESFGYNSNGNELESFNLFLKELNLYSLDIESLEKIISKLRELISNSEMPSLKSKFKFIDYAFITGFIILLISFIFYKYVFLTPFILYNCYVLYKEYCNPLIKRIKEKRKNELNTQEALSNICRISNILEMHLNIPINIEYKEEKNEGIKELDINAVIQDVEAKMEYVSENLFLEYYKRYTNALEKYYSLNPNVGEKELIDLSVELNELINNNKNESSINANFGRKRKINNDKNN